jgi:hypothetical protein
MGICNNWGISAMESRASFNDDWHAHDLHISHSGDRRNQADVALFYEIGSKRVMMRYISSRKNLKRRVRRSLTAAQSRRSSSAADQHGAGPVARQSRNRRQK